MPGKEWAAWARKNYPQYLPKGWGFCQYVTGVLCPGPKGMKAKDCRGAPDCPNPLVRRLQGW